MSLEPYSFCFLRYHHDPLAGEFANVGVLVWAPESGFVGFKASSKYSRISHFFGTFNSDDYRSIIDRIDRSFKKVAKNSSKHQLQLEFSDAPPSARDVAELVVPKDDGALRWSRSGGGLTASPQAILDRLYQDTIEWYYSRDEEHRRDERAIYRESYQRAFENPVVKPFIKEHLVEAPLLKHQFKNAWKNGAWNVYEVLSFDYKNSHTIQDAALKWGQRAQLLSEAKEKPLLHYLIGGKSEDHLKAYNNARDILHKSGVKIIEEHEAEDFSRDLAKKVKAEASANGPESA